MRGPILVAESVTKSFGAVTAVDSVSLHVVPGEIASIIGPNGAGKTTLFNVLSGFSPADSGTVAFDNRDVTKMTPHRIARLGIVRTFQTARPLRSATVLENVLAGSYIHGSGGPFASLLRTPQFRRAEHKLVERCLSILAAVGLETHANQFPSEMSAGQLRLLEIARALAAEPRLLLLDEPAAGLNAVETTQLEEILRDIRSTGTAVLLVEHDVDLVLRVSDQVTVLDFGKLLRHGKPEEIRYDPAVAAAYFGSEDENADPQSQKEPE